MNTVQLLGLQDPGGAKCAGIWTASTAGVMALSESFFEPPCSWRSEDLFGRSFSVAPPFRYLEGSLAGDPSLLFGASDT